MPQCACARRTLMMQCKDEAHRDRLLALRRSEGAVATNFSMDSSQWTRGGRHGQTRLRRKNHSCGRRRQRNRKWHRPRFSTQGRAGPCHRSARFAGRTFGRRRLGVGLQSTAIHSPLEGRRKIARAKRVQKMAARAGDSPGGRQEQLSKSQSMMHLQRVRGANVPAGHLTVA